LHVVPQIIRDPERGRRVGDDPFGGDLLRRMKEMRQDRRRARLIRISEALKLAVPQFADLELKDDEAGVPHLYASYAHWRPNASKQKETEFSDGTLRLVGLLWSIAEGGGPLLLEEPELSLNDAVVSELPKLFKRMQTLSGRQVVATTHSTAFLNDPGILLTEVHRIVPGPKGSAVVTASKDKTVVAQVENHEWTVGQAIVPLLAARGVNKLGVSDVAAA
jgi:predicted ATPase